MTTPPATGPDGTSDPAPPPTPADMPGAGPIGTGGGASDSTTDPADPESPAELRRLVAQWRSLSRKNEARAASNAEAAKQLKAIQDASKTAEQKAADDLAAANHRAELAESASARLLSAAQHELDPRLVDFLGSGTAEEINERADILAKVINEEAEKRAKGSASPVTGGSNGRPAESLQPGAQPSGNGATPGNNNEWFRRMVDSSQRQ